MADSVAHSLAESEYLDAVSTAPIEEEKADEPFDSPPASPTASSPRADRHYRRASGRRVDELEYMLRLEMKENDTLRYLGRYVA